MPKDTNMYLLSNNGVVYQQKHNKICIDTKYRSNILVKNNIYKLDRPYMVRYIYFNGNYILLPIYEKDGMIGFVNKSMVTKFNLNDLMIHNYMFDSQYSDIIIY